MGNPLVDQGTLNRIRGAVYWLDNTSLNVIASNLGVEGISLALDGEATTPIPTMTGRAQSPEPYQGITLTMNLLRTQNLANLYKQKMELSTLMGNGVVYPDVQAGGIDTYQINNCAIQGVRELRFNGSDAGWVVTLSGFYNINSSLFDG